MSKEENDKQVLIEESQYEPALYTYTDEDGNLRIDGLQHQDHPKYGPTPTYYDS